MRLAKPAANELGGAVRMVGPSVIEASPPECMCTLERRKEKRKKLNKKEMKQTNK